MNKTYKIQSTRSPYGEHKVETIGTINKVLMTCGGGMGGAQWSEFGSFKSDPEIGKMTEFVDAVTGETKVLNPQYIVEIEKKTLVKVTTDQTAHYNYSSKVCDKAIETRYIWIDLSDTAIADPNRNNPKDELQSHTIFQEVVKV